MCMCVCVWVCVMLFVHIHMVCVFVYVSACECKCVYCGLVYLYVCLHLHVCVHIKFYITSSHCCQGTQMFHVPRTPRWDLLYLCSDPSTPCSIPLGTVSLIAGILYKYNLLKLTLLNKYIFIYSMCLGVLPTCTSMHHVHA